MWYKIDYDKLAILLLPTFLRTSILVGFVQSILQEIDKIHYKWLQEREKHYYKLEHTGQVCKLRKLLNDNCDSKFRRITIEPGNSFERKYIYTKGEKKPVYLEKLFINSQNDYLNTGVDFIVNVPSIIFKKNQFLLIDLLKFYKLAGKRYKFEVLKTDI